jgi:hypothetical protein
MKKLLIGLISIISISAFGKVCEVNPKIDVSGDIKVILYLEDKDVIAEEDEHVSYITNGINEKKLDCMNLIREIQKSGQRTTNLEGAEVPIQLVLTIKL